jgi:hypothetical protein
MDISFAIRNIAALLAMTDSVNAGVVEVSNSPRERDTLHFQNLILLSPAFRLTFVAQG